MRTRSRDWDLPTGVHDPGTVAASVITDLKRRDRRIDRLTSAILKTPDLHHLTPAELATRQHLFAAARRGSKRAHAELWRLYRLRLLPPNSPLDSTRSSR